MCVVTIISKALRPQVLGASSLIPIISTSAFSSSTIPVLYNLKPNKLSSLLDNLFKYELVEEKISKRKDHEIDMGILGHAIFESSNYQELPDGIYRIISTRSFDNAFPNYIDFIFSNKKIIKSFNLVFWSHTYGIIQIDLDKQAIAICAHSGSFHDLLKVRLYRMR